MLALAERVSGSSQLAREVAEQFYVSIVRRARKLLRDDDAAKDIAQEVLMRVITSGLSSFDVHPEAWLSRVTTNLCLNSIRNRKRQRELVESFQAQPKEPELPDQALFVSELVAKIPAATRSIVSYYFVEDLTHEEIAARLGVSRRTIGHRLAALGQLGRC
jgi:RNA polymerase sigma-70 factor (ECF subfamily)